MPDELEEHIKIMAQCFDKFTEGMHRSVLIKMALILDETLNEAGFKVVRKLEH